MKAGENKAIKKNPENDEWQQVSQEFLSFNPPEYYGSLDPSVTWNWITEIEEMLDACGCDDLYKVKLGVRMLRGWGLDWWSTFCNTTIGKTKASCLKWKDFKNRMIKDFRLEDHKSKLEKEFLSLKMGGNMSLEEYGQEFVKRMRLVKHLVSNENYKIRRFKWGLYHELYENEVGEATTLTDAIFRAKENACQIFT